MESCVKITFDCLPLRSLPQDSSPTEGSPKFQELVGRIQSAIKRYGRHNAYYLYTARCVFHLTNSESLGMLDFRFEKLFFNCLPRLFFIGFNHYMTCFVFAVFFVQKV